MVFENNLRRYYLIEKSLTYQYFYLLVSFFFLFEMGSVMGQEKITDSNTPLHLLKPDYPLPYGQTTEASVKASMDKVLSYLEGVTPAVLLDNQNKEINNLDKIVKGAKFAQGDFRLTSYEWGVTYAGMFLASEITDDIRYKNYAFNRIGFLADLYPAYTAFHLQSNSGESPMKRVILPHALDDAGALGFAFIKAKKAGNDKDLDPMIQNFIEFISQKEYRLEDGTLARNRPVKNTLWLDDLFMSVPALAQYASYKNKPEYFEEAVKQVLLFSKRMFNENKGIYMHGYVEGAGNYPQYHWARANGWAFMAMVELLAVLPVDHPDRDTIMKYFVKHAEGLASYQSGLGFWHQLLDRKDSYLETSATAIFTYGFAKAINEGWLDDRVFTPLTILAWEAVASQINEKGQVEGTCVGTGMGFDPAFYYNRPVNVYAAHSYGPVLLAGAAVIQLIRNNPYEINETALQVLEK